jgi:hypothetical protein
VINYERDEATYRVGEYDHREHFQDFLLTCSDGVDIPIHRIMIVKYSKVFAAMLQIEMSESKRRKVKLEDINSKAMMEVLSYMYTEKVNLKGFDLAADVHYAANKYQITKLEAICVREMIRQTTKENVLKAFKLSLLFEIDELERKCLGIIHL